MGGTSLSVVVPAYNEEMRLLASLEAICRYLSGQPEDFELIVVNDGSTDNTLEIARSFAGAHPHMQVLSDPQNHGKGFAVRSGVLAASGERILFCDADLCTPIEEVEKLTGYLHQGYDIVIGSRPLKESRLAKRQPRLREYLGRAGNLLIQWLAVPGIHDTQCGFKLFRREAAHNIFSRTRMDRWSFDFEALYLAHRMFRYRIKEVPVTWYHREGSKLNVWRDYTRTLFDLLRMRFLTDYSVQTSDERRRIP
ncbi:MAG: glycosyltransferase family 2 protein [Armatimonadetes bacterium]|nr:glycosyltransferase family 2 protein [Armatimonadota bacterium]